MSTPRKVLDAIEAWNGLPPRPRDETELNALCSASDTITAWINGRAEGLSVGKDVNAYKELVLAVLRGEKIVSTEELVEAYRRAESTCTQIKRLVELEDSMPDTSKDEDTIVSHGNRQYSIGGCDPLTLSERENLVLDAFLGSTPGHPSGQPPLSSMDKPTLCRRSLEEAPTILRDLRTKYGGRFGPAIRLPRRKGQGGYQVRIRRA